LLSSLAHGAPATSSVRLDGLGLRSIDPLLPFLQALGSLAELDLSGNELRFLPRGLSSAAPRLASLNLKGTPIAKAADVLPQLQALTQLQELQMDLTPDEEDELVASLPSVRRYNGIVLDEEDYAAPGATHAPEEDSTRVPSDQPLDPASAAPPQAGDKSAIGTSQGPASNDGSPGQGSAAGNDNGNGNAGTGGIGSSDGDEEQDDLPPIREVALTEADLEQSAVLFGALKSLRVSINAEKARSAGMSPQDLDELAQNQDDELTAVFDRHLEGIMVELKRKLDGMEDPFVRQCAILEAKARLIDVCADQIVDHCHELPIPTAKQLASVARRVNQVRVALGGDLAQTVRDMRPHWAAKVQKERKRAEKAEDETARLLEAAQYLEEQLNKAGE